MTDATSLRCPHRPPCGGCALLDLPFEEQLERKRERLAGALGRFPSLAPLDLRSCVPAPSAVGYRTRAKCAVDRKAGEDAARIGLFRPGTHEVLDLPDCLVLHPALGPVLATLRRLLARTPLRVLHVDARWSLLQQRAHVTLVVAGPVEPSRALELAELLRTERPGISGVGFRLAAPGPVPRAVGGATRHLSGEPHLVEAIGEAKYRLSPGAFFQVDPVAAGHLHEIVRGWLGDRSAGRARQICDLYAGVGAFALSLADLAPQVTAVESFAEAAEDALAGARLSRREIRVVRSPVERFLEALRSDPPDRVVLDPPRRGVPPTALRALGAAAPRRLAYVSCDPDTLARDLDALVPLGLTTRTVVPVDLFSLTDEVEAVALLEPARAPWTPNLRWRGPSAVAADKPAILPTHPQARGETSLLDGVRSAARLADLQPVHRLDVGTSGPVLFAEGEALRALGRAFESGVVEKEYLALVKGIPRKSGRIRELPGGSRRSNARTMDISSDGETRYRLERVIGGYGLVRVFPGSGHRHQIRRHLARIGHPVLGDERHGDPRTNRFLAETCALARPFLHLAVLSFNAPGGDPVRLESSLPPELELVLERLVRLRAEHPSAGGTWEAE